MAAMGMTKEKVQQLPPLGMPPPTSGLASLQPSHSGPHVSSPTPRNVHPSSKATLAIVSAATRYEPHLPNFHDSLEKDVLISAACQVTSNMYAHPRL